MSKRLQVLLSDAEMKEVRQAARRNQLTTGEWVRRALRAARQSEPKVEVAAKLRAVREAVAHSFPTGDIGQMLAEIEQGYRG